MRLDASLCKELQALTADFLLDSIGFLPIGVINNLKAHAFDNQAGSTINVCH